MDTPSGINQQLRPFIKIFTFVGLVFLCWILAGVSLQSALPLFFGISDPATFLQTISHQSNPAAIIFILAVNSIGIFLLPPFIYFLVFNINAPSFLRLDRYPPLKFWLVGILSMFAAGIFIQVFVQVMTMIPLPKQFAYLRHQDKVVEDMIDAIFAFPSVGRLLLVTLTAALLPAVAEEIFFRGLIQNYLMKTNLGPIGAIIFTGLGFSMMHGEFDNFLAIWCMGIVLGLLYYYTGSLWVNITAHFVNNFTIVAIKYVYHLHLLHSDVSDTDVLPLYVTIPAGVMMISGLVLLKKWGDPPAEPNEMAHG